MTLSEVQAYWKLWALQASEGNPFTFLGDKKTGKGVTEINKNKKNGNNRRQEGEEQEEREDEEEEEQEQEEQEEQEEEQEEQEEEQEEQEQEQEGKREKRERKEVERGVKERENITATRRLPIPPTPEFDIDQGLSLPFQCDTPPLRTLLLKELAPRWGDSGRTYHAMLN